MHRSFQKTSFAKRWRKGLFKSDGLLALTDQIKGLQPHLWLEAYQAEDLTLIEGYKVSKWKNKASSGDTFDANMATDANRPLFRGEGLEFDKSAPHRLICGSPGDFNYLHDGSGSSVYFVGKVNPSPADDDQGGLFFTSSNGSSPGVYVEYNDRSGIAADNNIRVLMGSGSNIINDYLASDLYVDNERLIFNYRDSTADDFLVDVNEGSYTKTITPSGARTTDNHIGDLILGQAGGHYFNGNIYQVILFDRRLTDEEHNLVLQYINEQYLHQFAIHALSKVKLFVHADFGIVKDDQDFVTSWEDVSQQTQKSWQFTAARWLETGWKGKAAVRLFANTIIPEGITNGTSIFYTGDLDNQLLRAMIIAENLTVEEKTAISNYLKKIS